MSSRLTRLALDRLILAGSGAFGSGALATGRVLTGSGGFAAGMAFTGSVNFAAGAVFTGSGAFGAETVFTGSAWLTACILAGTVAGLAAPFNFFVVFVILTINQKSWDLFNLLIEPKGTQATLVPRRVNASANGRSLTSSFGRAGFQPGCQCSPTHRECHKAAQSAAGCSHPSVRRSAGTQKR